MGNTGVLENAMDDSWDSVSAFTVVKALGGDMPQSLPTICGPRRGVLAFLYRPPTPYPLVAFIAIKQDASCLNLSHHFRFVRSSVRKNRLLQSHIDGFESTRTRCSRLKTANHRDLQRMGHPCAGVRYLMIRSKPRSGKITVTQFYRSMNDEDVRSVLWCAQRHLA
jgi:hypothetical protein